MVENKKTYRGSCFCGSIEYQVSTPIKFVAHDHCSICQRISGSAFVTWCGVKSDQFRMIKGLDKLSSFKSTEDAERQFCSECGSHLFFRSSNWEGEVHFTRSSITDEMDEKPKVHVYYSDKVSWFEPNDDLPLYGGLSGMEPLDN